MLAVGYPANPVEGDYRLQYCGLAGEQYSEVAEGDASHLEVSGLYWESL